MTHIELFLDVSAAILLAAILVNRWLDDRRAMYYAHLDFRLEQERTVRAIAGSDGEDTCSNQAHDNDVPSSVSP